MTTDHAIVVGAGIAGLLAARVLRDNFDRVTIVERDRLPAEPVPRPGVPQGRQANALMAKGRAVIEELCPGFTARLTDAGTQTLDTCRDVRLCLDTGLAPVTQPGPPLQPSSRPLLETTLRSLVTAAANVAVVDGQTVTGLSTDGAPLRVTGVRLRSGDRLAADLVVDASGRSSHLRDWLTEQGAPRVPETVIAAGNACTTRFYYAPEMPAEWRGFVAAQQVPHLPLGVYILPVEHDRVVIGLYSAKGHAPRTDDGFTQAVLGLHELCADLLEPLRPLTRPVRYGHCANRMVHYDRARWWPDGLITLGDAVCTLNPVYAQGITTAALQARALRNILADNSTRHRTRSYQRLARRELAWPWLLATSADQEWIHHADPESNPRRGLPDRLANWYVARWREHVPTNPYLYREFAKMMHMMIGPASLSRPGLVIRILRRPPVCGQVVNPRVPRSRSGD
ncbi:FAD-dependent oxidoreductase [Nocardia brasiliensis]|uniref:FAD-dependent oxidoreductase n=1 Tax=Nocardia brasiliensis TaxID=37326 RepID=UPI0024569137|nr:FAD-dependent monooxygenase [Nocardia brasiliensis]